MDFNYIYFKVVFHSNPLMTDDQMSIGTICLREYALAPNSCYKTMTEGTMFVEAAWEKKKKEKCMT